jgi:hypothetical protein
MMNPLPESALALVAVMPSPKDLEIARLLGWYRIPLRMAPKLIDVDYLLFYQTGKFPTGHDSMIEMFAEVRGHELTTRSELVRNEPDHPRANEEYFKIILGPLQSFPEPIQTDQWKRITFFYTLGHLVNRARHVNDLVVRSDERDVLWKMIREKRVENYDKKEVQLEEIPEDAILELLARVITLNSGLNFGQNENPVESPG